MTKSAAEHWVCYALSRVGWAAALTRDGIERTDLLAVQTDSARTLIEVQVKGAQDLGGGDNTSWVINGKAQQVARSGSEWFVLVLLPPPGNLGAPRSFVVPRDHLSAATWLVHMKWLRDPTVESGKRNATVEQARVRACVWRGYENKWKLLLNSAYEAPVLLDPELRDWAQDPNVGLPPGHPWRDELPAW